MTLPGYENLVGPTTTSETTQIIRVSDEALNLIPGQQQRIELYNEADPDESLSLTPERICEAIEAANLRFTDLASQSRYSGDDSGLPIRIENSTIVFIFDQVTLAIVVNDESIEWVYPSNIEYVEKIKSAVNNIIFDYLNIAANEMNPQPPSSQPVTQRRWVFDTNTLYHDLVADQPTSILHSILPHGFFYQSTICIPWVVLYEMNKHPERGSGSKAANEQGIDNLRTLQTLDDLELLSLEFEDLPSEITTDVGRGDIADMYVLYYTDNRDAHLITGDQSLRDLASSSDIPAINTSQLITLSSPSGEDGSLESQVKDRIGINYNTHEEITEQIESNLDSDSVLPQSDSSRQRPLENPEAILNSWVNQGDILPHYTTETDELNYTQAYPIQAVISSSVLRFIDSYIESTRDGKYLTTDFLQQLRSQINTIDSSEMPSLSIIVPIEYVTMYSNPSESLSEFNRNLFQLRQTVNTTYRPRSATQSSDSLVPSEILANNPSENDEAQSSNQDESINTKDYLAIALASSLEDTHGVLPSSADYLKRYSQLLGTKVLTVDVPDDTG